MSNGLTVAAVSKNSIAEEMEIEPGDRILAVNGQELTDIVDFQFNTAEEEFVLLIEKADHELWEIEIERSMQEELGLQLEAVSQDGLKHCKNNCVFCFVAQMPKGMRETLYDKDDDYRLSLTQGSFITLTNLDDAEFDRILKYHLSPLFVSVHAWSPEARVRMMKNPKAADLATQLRRLAEAGIIIHAQIVLVPGYNDGEVLTETVRELGKLYPALQSIAVVPVGLTRFRDNLPELRAFSQQESHQLLVQGQIWQQKFQAKTGRHLLYYSDEFYAQAGWEYPQPEIYDDFSQIENGIGMASKFRSEFLEAIARVPATVSERKIHIITGSSAYPYFQDLARQIMVVVQGVTIQVHEVQNRFFGLSVTVAGLLTAQDIVEQVGNLNGELFLIPQVMLKADEPIFLDNKRVDWVAEKINGRVEVVDNHGLSFVEAVIGMQLEEEIS